MWQRIWNWLVPELQLILVGQNTLLKEMKMASAAVQKLQDDVTQLKTVVESAKTAFEGLAQQIRDLKDDPAALEALAADLESTSSDLAAAVAANTPSA